MRSSHDGEVEQLAAVRRSHRVVAARRNHVVDCDQRALHPVVINSFRVLPDSFCAHQCERRQSDLKDFSRIFRSPPGALSPGGRLVVVAGVAGNIVGWDLVSGVVRFSFATERRPTALAFFPDGRSVVTAGASITRFSADDGSLIGDLKAPEGSGTTSVAASPDGISLLVGLSTGEIAKYDATGGKVLRVLKGHASTLTGIALSPDGSAYASTAGRFDPRLWSCKDDSPSAVQLAGLVLACGRSISRPRNRR